MTAPHTPVPWPIGELEECGGYDCMTSAIQVGPVLLDGKDYGQPPCGELSEEGLARMRADAHLISSVHDLLAALKGARLELWRLLDVKGTHPREAREWLEIVAADRAITKAEGRP